MSTNRKTRSDHSKLTGFNRLESFHPFKTFLFFSLVGSTILFLAMAFLYILSVSRNELPENFILPKAFSVSTILMLFSSYSISLSISAYKNDSFKQLKLSLVLTVILGVLFSCSQVIGWKNLIDAGFFMSSHSGVAFLYLITAIHLVHVVGGLLYLMVLTSGVFGKSKDIAKSLMFLTDEYQLTRLQLITIYWHFVDGLWLLLYFMFLFTF